MDVKHIEQKLSSQEIEATSLLKRINMLQKEDYVLDDDEKTSEIKKLEETKEKLKYQSQHLKRNLKEELQKSKSQDPTSMVDIIGSLINTFQEAVAISLPEAANFKISIAQTTNDKYGDYQFNSAMSLSGFMAKLGKKTNPREVAQKIIKNLPVSDLIASTSIAGPGFVNITLNKEFIKKSLSKLLVHGVKVKSSNFDGKVVIDYSSPNIAKEMHVGHLRSTIIGDCLANLFEFLGHNVLRLNHVGDWGTQFGMLIAHLIDVYPNYQEVCPPIQDLQAFYKASKKRFDNESDFKERAYKYVVKLQSKSPDVLKAWNLICDASRKEFQLIYDRLNITNLIERGESYYHDLMPKAVEELQSSGMVQKEEAEGDNAGGRLLIFPKDSQYPLTVVKSDGGYTYDTSDLACIKQRIFEEKASTVLYVTDNGQASHFDLIFKTAREANWYNPDEIRVEHIGFGVVLGEDGKKFKTRSGDTVRLVDLLDEGLSRCEEKLKENGRNKVLSAAELESVKKAVAYGCIKYADLSHNLNNDYVFSFDKMLDDRGNTAAYLLYAYTRIKSIARNANVSQEELMKVAKASLDGKGLNISHPKEFNLAKCLLKFPNILNRVCQELTPHILCEYLYELSTCYTDFYVDCYCIEKDPKTGDLIKVHYERLLLCEATASVMEQGFKILGLQTVEKM